MWIKMYIVVCKLQYKVLGALYEFGKIVIWFLVFIDCRQILCYVSVQ